jgi:hypothetical protein
VRVDVPVSQYGGVLVVHTTKKLAQRIGGFNAIGDAQPAPLLGAWYATVMFWRPQAALFVSERTLLPVLMRFAPSSTLLARFPSELTVVLNEHGVPSHVIETETAALDTAKVVPTASRSLLGVLNEYVRLAEHVQRGQGSTDLLGLSCWLAETPMSPLFKGHGSPDRELAAAVAAIL